MGLEYSKNASVAWFTINNPSSLNALDRTTLRDFQTALTDFEEDPRLRVGIITGQGEKAFCSGIDIKNTLDTDMEAPLPPTLMRGLEIRKPLIAAINGLALGGGFELVLCCDIRVAVKSAQFGFPEVKLGLIPDWGGTQRIIRQLPWARAAALLLTGMAIDSVEAREYGLINEICAPDELLQTAEKWAERVSLAAPLAVQAAKETMLKGSQLNLDEGLQLEDALFAYLKTTSDYHEGLRAFREHRPPEFRGE